MVLHVARCARRNRDPPSRCLRKRYYRTIDGTSPPSVLLLKTRSRVASPTTNGGRYALLGVGILYHRYRRRCFWIWRHRSHGFEYRADTVLRVLGYLPDHAGHGGGWPTATTDLRVSRPVEVSRDLHQLRFLNRRLRAPGQAGSTLPDAAHSGFGQNCGQAPDTSVRVG